ncbi:MAG TPA: 2'-5' RNA ligase family protein [Caulobacteraceae bacterium]|jgi:2'-5' RNA ligase|nr:2'-5' RNA ligase family protein [Caulobacteraceae bacterium]
MRDFKSPLLGADLFGEVEDAPTKDRLLFLIYPDEATAARIAALAARLRNQLGLHGHPHAQDRFHITLQHIGDYAGLPADLVALARQAASALTIRPFQVNFDRAASFDSQPRNLPFVLRGDELGELVAFNDALAVAMKRTGSRLGKRVKLNFTPHVTLLYDDRSIAELPIEPIGWTVREFVLVHSLIGQTQHKVLGRWSLVD